MRMLSLFSGIGGIDLAGHWAGMQTVAFCEIEPFPQQVLRKHWPDVPIIPDVHDVTRKELTRLGVGAIDIISAGYPCQPFSHAGKRQGTEDDRHLWPEVARILQEFKPRWFIGENVAGHISLGLDDVLADLEAQGYETQTFVLPACGVNASHQRYRVFVVGYAESITTRGLPIRTGTEDSRPALASQDVANPPSTGLSERRQSRFATTGTEARTRTQPGPERCGEVVGNTPSQRCGEAREHRGRSEERTPGASADVADTEGQRCAHGYDGADEWKADREINAFTDASRSASKNVANASGAGCQERDTPTVADRSGYGTGSGNAGRSVGTTQSGLGRNFDELPSRLDGDMNPLDALAALIAAYPQPALMGQPQHDWEPPRVATGVKNRAARIKALGNAVDPLQIYPILATIKYIDDMMR